jgi:hypothetical protein
MHKEIIIPIYDCLVSIQVTVTMDEAVKHLTDTYGITEDEDLSNMGGFCNSDNSPLIDRQIYYLVVGYTLDKKEYWATIAHETMHLIQEVLESRDIYYQRKQPNEPYAYMYGYFISENFEFFEQAYSKFKRLKVKK